MLHSPRAAPMFLATSYAKLLNRASLHRLFRCAPTLWLPTRSPRAAPMFLVLRTRFTTSAWVGRYVFATSSMPSCSTVRLHRLFRVGATVYMQDTYYSLKRLRFDMTLRYRHLLRCFSSYGRVSQHLPALPCLLILCAENRICVFIIVHWCHEAHTSSHASHGC